jgi:TPR repeat protein
MSEKNIAEKVVQADNGDHKAQLELAFYFARDPGARDYQRAHSYYTKAANSGSSIAQHNLACMYLNGDGCQRNLDTGSSKRPCKATLTHSSTLV